MSVEELAARLQELLPSCDSQVHGPCYEGSKPSGRGFAFYPAGERVCSSTILLPGFNLLPRPLLGGVLGLYMHFYPPRIILYIINLLVITTT